MAYRFYRRFWHIVGSVLTAVLQDAFTSPASLRQLQIILLYEGKGPDRTSPASHKPITLLNTDYRLAPRIQPAVLDKSSTK